MEDIKISLITTVFNEEKAIESFLNSVLNQTRLPNEVVIVDAGSTDKTIEKIQSMAPTFEQKNTPITTITRRGNRATGRNEAVRNAKHDYIVCSDVGCILDATWLQLLAQQFLEGAEVVAGYYYPTLRNQNVAVLPQNKDTLFQRCLATYTSVMPDRFDANTYLPSSRSIGFTKQMWQKVGGYPEELDFCEDLVFAKELKKAAGAHFTVEKDATVYWPQKKTFPEAFRQFYNYAKGDGKALYFRKRTPLLFMRYMLAGTLIWLGLLATERLTRITAFQLLGQGILLYILWAITKNFLYVWPQLGKEDTPTYDEDSKGQTYFILPALQITADVAVMMGMLHGLLERFLTKSKRA